MIAGISTIFGLSLKRASESLRDASLSMIFPLECRVCGAIIESWRDGVACAACWREVENRLEQIHAQKSLCGKCGLPLQSFPQTNQLEDQRCGKCEEMAFSLASACGVYEGALCFVTNPSLISRAHFARYLVSIGIARDVPGVFQHYLAQGKPGYVDHRWATLEEAVRWINGAGGTAVVAHPGRYKMSGAQMRSFLDDFKDVGGRGIEVTCGSHSPDHVMHFARLARHYEFHASRGSDFHGPEESYVDLGKLPLESGDRPVQLAARRASRQLLMIAPPVRRFDFTKIAAPAVPWVVFQGDRDELARFASDKTPAPKTPPGSPIGEDCWFCTPLDLTRD